MADKICPFRKDCVPFLGVGSGIDAEYPYHLLFVTQCDPALQEVVNGKAPSIRRRLYLLLVDTDVIFGDTLIVVPLYHFSTLNPLFIA